MGAIYGFGKMVDGNYQPDVAVSSHPCTASFGLAVYAKPTHIIIGHGKTPAHADFMKRCCEYFPWLPKWGADYPYDAVTPKEIQGESLYKVINLVCYARGFSENNPKPSVLKFMDRYGTGAGILIWYMTDSYGDNYGSRRNRNHDLFSEWHDIYDICRLSLYPETWEPSVEYIIGKDGPVKYVVPPSYIMRYANTKTLGWEVFRDIAVLYKSGKLAEDDIYNLIKEAADGKKVFDDLSRFDGGTAVCTGGV